MNHERQTTMTYFQIKIPVLSRPRDEGRETYRDDAIVLSVKAEDESAAVAAVTKALEKLVTHKAVNAKRVFETL
jgi:hypothetical protein